MFRWIKKMVSSGQRTKPASAAGEPHGLRVEDVMDNFLAQNPKPTPFMVHALVAAGGADLPDSDAVLRVCEKIQLHGYQYPLNPTLRRQLKPNELRPYLRWHASAQIDQEAYRDENSILDLIQRFRKETASL